MTFQGVQLSSSTAEELSWEESEFEFAARLSHSITEEIVSPKFPNPIFDVIIWLASSFEIPPKEDE